ncbi:cornifelin-like protein [Lamellibrachia satsuma]|nr:cornifelin-like protein [Lamellibrachia satsuma]
MRVSVSEGDSDSDSEGECEWARDVRSGFGVETMATHVVMQQPAAAVILIQPRDWSTGTCACCEDCGGCWYALFCPSCFLCGISTRMNENCCAMSVAPVAMRTKLRIENNIQGSVCDDYCQMGCCSMLIYCQMDRELKHLGR